MIEYQSSIIIVCPASEVFAFIGNADNLSKWRLDVQQFEVLTPGTIVNGTRWIEHTTHLGQRSQSEIEVVDVVPGEQYTTMTLVQKTIKFMTVYRAESAPEGTKFVIDVQGEIAGVLKMAEPLMRKQIVTSLDSNLRQLKQLMEATS